MRVGIVAQKGNARAAYLAGDVRELLGDRDVEVWLDEATAGTLDEAGVAVSRFGDCDLVVSIGGDGTFLYASRGAGSTPIMGVNLGEVGFLNAVAPDEAVEAVAAVVDRYRETEEAVARELPRLCARGEDGWSLPPALNEVVVQGPRRGHGQGASFEIRVDGDLYAGSHADGVLVATPTGSTAYNLSEGGPLVHHDVAGLVVTPMVAGDPVRPLVVSIDAEVAIRIDDAAAAVVASDGREQREVSPPELVRIDRAGEPARVAGPELEFFAALDKLE